MKNRIVSICLFVLFLCGCQPAKSQDNGLNNPPPPETTQTEKEETPPPVVVYPGAEEYYLGQITDYSWEQEFPPEFVVLHFCSAVVNHPKDPYNHEYVRQTFINAGVSIHYLIDREGKVFCYIPENRSAWHAGAGTWGNEEKYTNKMNKYSIGIELMGMGTQKEMSIYMTKANYNKLKKEWLGFTEAQYVSLKALLTDVCTRNNIPMDRAHIIGHDQYNPKKRDPGDLFDWSKILP